MRLFTIKEWFVDDKTGTTIMGDWRRFEAKTVRRVVENAPQYFALVQCISMNLRSIFLGFFFLYLGKIIRDYEIGREFYEQEEGTTTVSRISTQSMPDEEVEEIHCQARQEDKRTPIQTALHPPEIEADGQ